MGALISTMGQIPLFSLLSLILFWSLVCFMLSIFGGWRRLAEVYRADDAFQGKLLRWQSAIMRYRISYNNCLNFGENYRGLYITPLFLFRIGHPPLFVPLSDITVIREEGRFIMPVIRLRFAKAPDIPFRVTAGLLRKLLKVAGQQAISGR